MRLRVLFFTITLIYTGNCAFVVVHIHAIDDDDDNTYDADLRRFFPLFFCIWAFLCQSNRIQMYTIIHTQRSHAHLKSFRTILGSIYEREGKCKDVRGSLVEILKNYLSGVICVRANNFFFFGNFRKTFYGIFQKRNTSSKLNAQKLFFNCWENLFVFRLRMSKKRKISKSTHN